MKMEEHRKLVKAHEENPELHKWEHRYDDKAWNPNGKDIGIGAWMPNRHYRCTGCEEQISVFVKDGGIPEHGEVVEAGPPMSAEPRDRPPFKVGDKVKCIDNPYSGPIQEGRIYTIKTIEKNADENHPWMVSLEETMYGGWYSDRFEVVKQEPRENQPPFNVGDKVRVVNPGGGSPPMGTITTITKIWYSQGGTDHTPWMCEISTPTNNH